MKSPNIPLFFFFFIFSVSAPLFEAFNDGNGGFKLEEKEEEPQIKRSDFPPGFLFGLATSAYQVEGAYLEDGKSLSNWDVFCHSVGCGVNGETGDIADDHYHLFLNDIEMMHSLGVKAYKFSISWARILPKGRFGEVNPAGILFYNNIIDNLLLKGIEPFVTLFHNDYPQELEQIYGHGPWLNPEMQEDYVHLAETCFKSFGDRVKYWITINEPNVFIELSYEFGFFPPSRCSQPFGKCNAGNSDVEPLIAMHNMLLAHGRATKLYHETFQPKQGGSIGLVMHCYMYEPLTDSKLDHEAVKRAFAFNIGWALDPAIHGDYPEEMRKYLGSALPSFSLEEKKFMKNSIDFIGINHYSAIYTKDCLNSSCSSFANRAIRGFLDIVGERDGVLIGELTGARGIFVVPRGMGEIVDRIKSRYNNKPMFITENGYCSPDVHEEGVDEILNGVKRIEFHSKYLASLVESIRMGADVRGYFAWSLMDSYEWGQDRRSSFHPSPTLPVSVSSSLSTTSSNRLQLRCLRRTNPWSTGRPSSTLRLPAKLTSLQNCHCVSLRISCKNSSNNGLSIRSGYDRQSSSKGLLEGPSCLFVGPIESASQETLEALYRQARDAYYSGKPLILDDMFDRVELKLRWYGSKYVVKYPRCSLRQQSTYADAEIYLMDIHIWYTLLSAIVGGVMGARGRLGEIRSIEMVHKRFESFPEAFVKQLVSSQAKRVPIHGQSSSDPEDNNAKTYAAQFSPFWNEIIKSLREEDYISNREMDLLSMPVNTGSLGLVQWPLFLLSSKIYLAIDLAIDCKDNQSDLWGRIIRDMAYAVQECYYSIEKILLALVYGEGKLWVERIFREINNSMSNGSLLVTLDFKKLPLVLSRFNALTGLLIMDEKPELAKGAAKAVYELYEVVTHGLLSSDLSEQLDTWNILARARNEGRLFANIGWPRDPDIKEQVKRLHLLLKMKDSAANVPKNLEARRRLEFFTNSLFMHMPPAKPVSEMMPFCVFTPYYSETVLYSSHDLWAENEDGISTIFYLQKIFPDEWENFLERIGRVDTGDVELQDSATDALELRFWVSYRGQTLARTVRGMMYYRRALMLQSYLENRSFGEAHPHSALSSQGFEMSRESRAQADLKFTYVVSCQIYGQQKQRKEKEATDIALLLQRNEALRVAFIHVEESPGGDGKITKSFYSKLVKADINGKDQEIYSIKLPGDPKLGEGKPENQNHAIVFTRGEAIQTIDMNQDNYLEEAMKMRNLLEEFRADHGLRPPTILGVREHVFTGSVSSLAWFMSNQETSFVTLGQRVLAYPLKVRMHYGHPDVFDRIFHISRGGISKASRVINISEDIYAGFNSTLRQGNITHHEYIQVGKGRDVGLNQIALFEGKVAGGNGEQVLSRDVYRIGQLFDFFRMLSFYFTTVGYYVCTMMTVLTVYIFLYGRAYLAFSGLDEGISTRSRILGNTAFNAVLNTQFLVQIGVFTAVPMVMGFILESGLLKAIFSFITMQLQLCSVFFTFSLGTRTHYFGRTILHGGAKYKATGRGFVVQHIKFADNYRLYSRSHFVKAMEVTLLLIVYIGYGYTQGGTVSYVLLTLSSWFLVVSWLFAPYIFNPSGFEWQKTVEDFDDWTNWLMYKGGVGVKGENSWESWWDEEQAHIQTLRGRILETLLSLRFFIFQYGIIYKLHLTGDNTSISLYGFSWVALLGIVLIFKIFTFSSKKSKLQLLLRFIQGAAAISLIAALCLVVIFTGLTVADLFASTLAFVATGWAVICVAVAWKGVVRRIGLWESVREFARMYDAGMGMVIFAPIAMLSWFPFVSTFQSRLLFNQAFSRGLEISLILAGNKANVQA